MAKKFLKLLFLADVPINAPASGAEQVLNRQAVLLRDRTKAIYAITRRNGSTDRIDYCDIGGINAACFSANPNMVFSFLAAHLKHPIQLYNRYHNRWPFSTVICHQPFTGIPLLLSLKLRGIPIIYIFHSSSFEEYIISTGARVNLRRAMNARVRKLIEGYCLKRSRRIMVLSKYMKGRLIELYQIPSEKIVINPGGADFDRFRPFKNRHQVKKDRGLPAHKIHLLTVRNLEPRMGLDNLIKAIDLLKMKKSEVHLVIGGDGRERNHLRYLINKYGLSKDITMTGFIPDDDLPMYYSAADFFIIPTRKLEGFGLVTIESMACETPVLGTPVGATHEILANFDSRLLFNDTAPESIAEGIQAAIEKFFRDSTIYNRLRVKCREYVRKNYSWQRHVDRLKTTIDDLIN
jgi:glycosyltransferase involved in cell wall biosynthesis